MNDSARHTPSPYLDDPVRRLVWIFPLTILLWAAVLVGFGLTLGRVARSAHSKPIEVGIEELPPAEGLQRQPAAASLHPQRGATAVRKAAPPVHHAIVTHHVHKNALHHRERIRRPRVVEPPSHASAPPAASPPASKSKVAPAVKTASIPPPIAGRKNSGPAGNGVHKGNGNGSRPGVGGGNLGAHAIYAPAPVIPDDLRDNAFTAVAVARFIVSRTGDVKITLVKPTSSPELNAILIATLKNWRFFPATRNGVAIDSQFELRIPISVQ